MSPETLAAPDDGAYPPPMDDAETCPRCDGEGLVAARGAAVMVDQAVDPPATPCPVCGGKGEVHADPT